MESNEGGEMFTSETAPKGYTGPVQLTDAERERLQQREDNWLTVLILQARDDSDPETQANARLLLTNRGMEW